MDGTEKICFEGYLEKEGHRFKTWKKRYFRLYPSGLAYFRDKWDSKPLNFLELLTAPIHFFFFFFFFFFFSESVCSFVQFKMDGTEKICFEGYLEKEGHRFKTWKKRYFRLYPSGLAYFRDKWDSKPLNFLELDRTCWVDHAQEKDEDPLMFKIVTSASRCLYCRGLSACAVSEWMDALRSNIEGHKAAAREQMEIPPDLLDDVDGLTVGSETDSYFGDIQWGGMPQQTHGESSKGSTKEAVTPSSQLSAGGGTTGHVSKSVEDWRLYVGEDAKSDETVLIRCNASLQMEREEYGVEYFVHGHLYLTSSRLLFHAETLVRDVIESTMLDMIDFVSGRNEDRMVVELHDARRLLFAHVECRDVVISRLEWQLSALHGEDRRSKRSSAIRGYGEEEDMSGMIDEESSGGAKMRTWTVVPGTHDTNATKTTTTTVATPLSSRRVETVDSPDSVDPSCDGDGDGDQAIRRRSSQMGEHESGTLSGKSTPSRKENIYGQSIPDFLKRFHEGRFRSPTPRDEKIVLCERCRCRIISRKAPFSDFPASSKKNSRSRSMTGDATVARGCLYVSPRYLSFLADDVAEGDLKSLSRVRAARRSGHVPRVWMVPVYNVYLDRDSMMERVDSDSMERDIEDARRRPAERDGEQLFWRSYHGRKSIAFRILNEGGGFGAESVVEVQFTEDMAAVRRVIFALGHGFRVKLRNALVRLQRLWRKSLMRRFAGVSHSQRDRSMSMPVAMVTSGGDVSPKSDEHPRKSLDQKDSFYIVDGRKIPMEFVLPLREHLVYSVVIRGQSLGSSFSTLRILKDAQGGSLLFTILSNGETVFTQKLSKVVDVDLLQLAVNRDSVLITMKDRQRIYMQSDDAKDIVKTFSELMWEG
eukprot:TRINITY_DN45_c0_g2_i1.p1 TRINITY_DN45_c0_g2~~TRINITY_DN45_c0_g2_i1.p1  ORF type:complete len:912 (-),score=237.62 TRINITY_DN45_c0_g2_i1:1362-3977(-)